jgi:hypothetical protein
MRLSVVIPFYNELRTLPTVMDRLLTVDFASLGLLGGIAWRAAIRMAWQARPTRMLVTLHDRLIVPAERAIKRRIQPPFGHSVLCVARVPGPPRA